MIRAVFSFRKIINGQLIVPRLEAYGNAFSIVIGSCSDKTCNRAAVSIALNKLVVHAVCSISKYSRVYYISLSVYTSNSFYPAASAINSPREMVPFSSNSPRERAEKKQENKDPPWNRRSSGAHAEPRNSRNWAIRSRSFGSGPFQCDADPMYLWILYIPTRWRNSVPPLTPFSLLPPGRAFFG